MKNLLLSLILIFSSTVSFAQTVYTWDGSVDTDFATADNWTPSGVPGSGDEITIVTTSNDPVLDGNRTVNKLTMTSGLLKLATYDITITTTGTFNGGTIENGKLAMTATSGVTTFSGTTMDCEVAIDGKATIYANSLFKESATLSKITSLGASTFEKKAELTFTRYNLVTGGNVFKDTTIINAASASGYSQYMGSTTPDTFLAPVAFNLITNMVFYLGNSSSGNYFADDVTIHLSANSTSDFIIGNNAASSCLFEGDIILNVDNGAGSINFKLGTNEHDGSLLIGSGGYHNKTLTLGAYTQLGTQTVDLSDMDPGSSLVLGTGLILEGDLIGPEVSTTIGADCRFKGEVTLPDLAYWSGSVFDKKADLTMTRYNMGTGGNVFKDTTVITSASVGGYSQWLGNTEPDTFLAPLTINMENNVFLYLANNSAGNYFADDVTIHLSANYASDLVIGNNASSSTRFEGDIILNVDSTAGSINFKLGTNEHNGSLVIGTDGYHNEILELNAYTQLGPHLMDLSSMDHNSKLLLEAGLELEGDLIGPNVSTTLKANCIFNGDLTLPKLDFWSGYTTCNGKADLKMTRYNTFVGGNVYKDSTIITAASAQGYTQRIGYLVADTFLAPVTIKMQANMNLYVGNGSTGNYFTDDVTFVNAGWGSSKIYICSSAASSVFFGGDIYVESSSGGGIQFYAGDVQHDGVMKVGPNGYSYGLLSIDAYVQTASGTMDLSGIDNTATISILDEADITADLVYTNTSRSITLNGATFRGNVSVESPSLPVSNCDFHGITSLKKTAGVNNLNGGNMFRGVTTLDNSAWSNYLLWGYSVPDTFLTDVSLINNSNSQHLYVAYSSASVFHGDINFSGTSSKKIHLGYTTAGSKAVIEGSNDQAMTISDGIDAHIYRMEMNKASGRLKLYNDIQVYNELALTDGIIECQNDAVITLADDVEPTGTDGSHVEGAVKKIGNDIFEFPIGRNSTYRPASISAPSNTTDAFTAEYHISNSDWAYEHDSKEGSIEDISRKEFWTIDRTAGTSNITISLSWDTLKSCPVDTLDNLIIVAWDTSAEEWKDLGNGGTTGDSDAGTIDTDGASSYYGTVAIASRDSILCDSPYLGCGPLSTVSDTIEESYITSPTLADHFGNKYPLDAVRIDSTTSTEGGSRDALLCTSGYFRLYFEQGSGMETVGNQAHDDRRSVVCAVYQDLSDFIDSELTISGAFVNVWVRDLGNVLGPNDPPPAASGVLGAASPYYVLPPPNTAVSGVIDNQVWITINSGTDAYTNVSAPLIPNGQSGNFYHNFLALNFENPSFLWNTTTGSPSINERDLYTVVLHEAIHALGFASLIDQNGNSKLGLNFPYYTRYDMFLETQAGQNLIGNTGSCSMYQFGFNASAADLATATVGCIPDQTVCANAIEYSGAVDQLVYTPNCFELPSSLSHFEDECQVPIGFNQQPPNSNNLYFVMSNANGQGTDGEKRYPKPEERHVLCDLGYNVLDEFGGSLFTSTTEPYLGGDCPGLQVAGINDGITATGTYAYIGDDGSVIDISDGTPNSTDILDNDFNANQFECLEVIYGQGILSVTTGSAATGLTYTPNGSGVHLLRYIPVNTVTGNEGNITYIFVYATSGNCVPSTCDLVSNGGFEFATPNCGNSIGNNVQLDCWDRHNGSPDLHGYACDLPFAATVLYAAGTGTHNTNVNGNMNFMGLFNYESATIWNHESAQTLLSSPILPGNSYRIRFWVNRGAPTQAGSPSELHVYGDNLSLTAPTNGALNTIGLTLMAQVVVDYTGVWEYHDILYDHPAASAPITRVILFQHVNPPRQTYYRMGVDDLSILPVNSAPVITMQSPVCLNQTVVVGLTPPGGVLTGNGITCLNGACSFDAALAGVGTHLLTYNHTDINGCVTAHYIEVEVINSNFSVAAGANPAAYACNAPTNADLILTAIPTPANVGISYEWNPGALTNNPQTIVSPIESTTYVVTATDGNGCVDTDDVTVTVGDGGVTAVISSNPACIGGADGTATVTPSGGQVPYTFLWDDPSAQISQTATGLAAGLYTATVTDANGCESDHQITVNDVQADNLTIDKSVVNGSSFANGETVEYEIEVCNIDDIQTVTNIEVTDELHEFFSPSSVVSNDFTVNGSTLTADVTTLAPLGCVTLEFEINILDAAIEDYCDNGNTLENCATITDATGSCNYPEDCIEISLTGPSEDLTLTNTSVTGAGLGSNYNGVTWVISGLFTVNSDLTLTNCEIIMEQNAWIIVNSGYTFTLDGTHIYACEELWRTIVVGGGAELIVDNDALIEDAYVGSLLLKGADYTINKSTYNKNRIHVYRWSVGSGVGTGTITASKFLCNEGADMNGLHTTLHSPLQNTRTYIAIANDLDEDFVVGASGNGNYIENADIGINSIDASLSSLNNRFVNVDYDPTIPESGRGIYTRHGEDLIVDNVNFFQQGTYGIEAYGQSNDVLVRNSYFSNNGVGMLIGDWNMEPAPNKNIDISGNHLASSQNWIQIWLESNPDAEINIEDNEIIIFPFNNTWYGFGIGVFEAATQPGTELTVTDNTVSNGQRGIWCRNLQGWGPFVLNDEPFAIKHNTVNVAPTASGLTAGIIGSNVFGARIAENRINGGNLYSDYHRAGIRFGAGAWNLLDCNSSVDVGNGITVDAACEPSFLVKNEFDGTLVGLALNYGTLGHIGDPASGWTWDNTWVEVQAMDTWAYGSDASNYEIMFRTDAPEATFPAPPIPVAIYEPTTNLSGGPAGLIPGLDFETNPGTTANNMKAWDCAEEGSPAGILPDTDGQRTALKLVLKDTSTVNSYHEEMHWAGKLNVYRALQAKDSLMLNDSLLTAFYDSCFTANLGRLIRASGALHSGKDGSKYIDTLTNMTATLTPEDAWRDVLLVAYDKATETEQVADSTSYRITAVLDSIFPDSTFTVVQHTDIWWSSADRTTLEDIAEECPYEYGEAVYMARDLLSRHDTIPYHDYHTCEITSQPPSQRLANPETGVTPEEESNFNLYPNPNTGQFNVSLSLKDEEGAQIMVFSTSGQLIQKTSLASGVNPLTLNVADGLYFYMVTVNGTPKWNGKISVVVY